MYVDSITFSGADNSIDPAELLLHCVKLDTTTADLNIELAILLSAKNMGKPRYPSFEWLDKLAEYNSIAKISLAGHMCGQWARDMAQGNFTFVQEYPNYWKLFNRIQINLKNYTDNISDKFFINLEKYSKGKQYIIQMDGVHDWILDACLERDINVAPLFDKSGGEGKTPDEWPIYKNDKVYEIGYAGGFGPENVFDELNKIKNANKDNDYTDTTSIWIDMESKIRDINDKFDIKKCIKVYNNVIIYNCSNSFGMF